MSFGRLRLGLGTLGSGRGAAGGGGPIDYEEFPPDEFLGAALIAWWDPSGPGLTQAGNVVSSWVDEIGARNPTAAGSPGYDATGLNGHPCVTFNGTDQKFFSTTGVGGDWPTATAEGWVWGIASQDGGAGALDTVPRCLVAYGTSSTGSARGIEKISVGGTANRARAIRTSSGSPSGVADLNVLYDGIHIVGAKYIEGGGTNSITGRIDGANFSASGNTFSTSATRLGIGCDVSSGTVPGSFWKGKIGDILVTTAITDAQRDYIEGYLAWKYGV